jgi:hypothetical protein
MKTKTHSVLAALPSVRMTLRSQNGWRRILCCAINSKFSELTLIWSCSDRQRSSLDGGIQSNDRPRVGHA